jgi:hypothetical protein
MQNTVTGTTMMMKRATGSTAPRWTLTIVVVVLNASSTPLNLTISFDCAGDGPVDYWDFFSCCAINNSRRSMMSEIA